MFLRSAGLNVVCSVLWIIAMGACGDLGGCSALGPLPTGGLPKDQTIEGGAQVRVTPAGFNKLTSVLPGLLNEQLKDGFCIPQDQVGSMGTFGTGARYCTNNNGAGCNPACKVNVALNSLVPVVTDQQTLNIRISTRVNTTIGIDGKIVGVGFSCNLGVQSDNLNGDLDIRLDTDPATGNLNVHLARINSFRLNLDFSGCGPLSSIGDFASDFLDSFIGQFIIRALTPAINDLLQSILPDSLGIEGMLDVGQLVESLSPGTEALMEARLVTGGYANLVRGGLSLGVITGLNADEDPATRGPMLTSEPHLCAPPLPAPDFSAAPALLPKTTRGTYSLGVAAEFDGTPDPQTDLAMGVSETTLDLAGHHAVTSGMMCLGVGTRSVAQLNLGTIGLLVPSLAQLGSDAGNDPVLLVTRPQRALDFTIGDNTLASPALTIGISHLEVDFYAFLYERYVRAFTMDVSLNVGVNLEFEQLPGGATVIKPALVGISSGNVAVTVLNSQFVAEAPDRLEAVLPSVFDLVTPLLGNIPAIPVPSFASFTLDNLSIQRVATSQDEFLALSGSLTPSMLMRSIAERSPLMASAVRALDAGAQHAFTGAPRSTGRAKLARVTTPEPAQVRSALARDPSGALPEVVFDVDRVDAAGRELEWSYNLNGDMWRAYTSAAPLVIRDRAFAWQGAYTIGLKSRVKGNYRTVSAETVHEVVIDSVGPRVFDEKAAWDGDTYTAPIWDIVAGRKVQYALGKPGGDGPESAWRDGSVAVSRDELAAFAVGGEVAVYAKDQLGNQTIALLAPFHGQPGESGCNCSTGGGPSSSGIAIALLVGAALVVPRRRRRSRRFGRHARQFGLWLGVSVVMSLVPGCSCGEAGGKSCEVVADCGTDFCPDGQVAFCIDNQCICSDDIPPGTVGPYSDVAVGPDGSTWVSAYAQSYGDLVVARVEPGRVPSEAWEWVDGVPDGPVVVENAKHRGGIAENGEDAGMYTSIAVAPDGTPMVTYFERETGSLRFAVKRADGWHKHVIEQGTTELGQSGALVGMYTSITLRTDDGRPGVAYLAHVADANGRRAEVRFAAAQVPVPTSAGDWQFWVVDTAPLPDGDGIYPLPEGLGLFIDAARLRGNQAPVVVYYDRANGDLKLSKFDVELGQFGAPRVLDGAGNVDAGWAPSVAIGADDTVHVAYVGATGDDLKYVTDAPSAAVEKVDDGYRIVGTTVDGLPKPEFHFVGDDASLVMANNGTVPMIAYQDATTQELLLATRQLDGTWTRISIAGATVPWPGGYGFFTANAVTQLEIVMSTWVIDQPANDNWVEVFRRPTGPT